MDGRKVLLTGLLLLGTADVAVLDLVAAPAWLSAAPTGARSGPTRAPAAPVAALSTSAAAVVHSPASAAESPSPAPKPSESASAGAAEPSVESPRAALPGAPALPALIFQQGSSVLTPASVATLMKASRFLKATSGAAVVVYAHAWNEGAGADARALSEERGAVTADFLAAVGVDRSRTRIVAHGGDDPAEREGSADEMARLRRVELVFEARELPR